MQNSETGSKVLTRKEYSASEQMLFDLASLFTMIHADLTVSEQVKAMANKGLDKLRPILLEIVEEYHDKGRTHLA